MNQDLPQFIPGWPGAGVVSSNSIFVITTVSHLVTRMQSGIVHLLAVFDLCGYISPLSVCIDDCHLTSSGVDCAEISDRERSSASGHFPTPVELEYWELTTRESGSNAGIY
jgi:hypothetical protein